MMDQYRINNIILIFKILSVVDYISDDISWSRIIIGIYLYSSVPPYKPML